MNLANAENAVYTISSVSQMTGINAVTLRAWERRYGLVKPSRTEAGHRLYSDANVEQIRDILQLLDQGIAISRVPEALKESELQDIFQQQDQGPWKRYQDNMLKAIQYFDEATLESTYNEAMSLYPIDVVTKQLLLPLINSLGEKWMQEASLVGKLDQQSQMQSLGIAEEHFFSVFMRNKLGARFHHRNLQNSGQSIVAACLPGEQHEFGLLLFALAAHARGYRIVLLGANMPMLQLSEVVKRTASSAIVLSGSIASVKTNLDEDIRALSGNCKVPVFIGGSYGQSLRDSLEELGALPVSDDLNVALHMISKKLNFKDVK